MIYCFSSNIRQNKKRISHSCSAVNARLRRLPQRCPQQNLQTAASFMQTAAGRFRSGISVYSFTDPDIMPATMLFWKMMKSSTVGISATTTPAMTGPKTADSRSFSIVMPT